MQLLLFTAKSKPQDLKKHHWCDSYLEWFLAGSLRLLDTNFLNMSIQMILGLSQGLLKIHGS